MMTAVAVAVDGNPFIDGCKAGNIGSGYVAALGANKGCSVVAGDEDFLNHAGLPL